MNVYTTFHHWFFIGLTIHPLTWYSLVHCIGTFHWLFYPLKTQHCILLDWNHHHWINSCTQNINCFTRLKFTLNLVHEAITTFRLIHALVAFVSQFHQLNCVILVSLTNRLRHQHFRPSNWIITISIIGEMTIFFLDGSGIYK